MNVCVCMCMCLYVCLCECLFSVVCLRYHFNGRRARNTTFLVELLQNKIINASRCLSGRKLKVKRDEMDRKHGDSKKGKTKDLKNVLKYVGLQQSCLII